MAIGRPRFICDCGGSCYRCRHRAYREQWARGEKPSVSLHRGEVPARAFKESEIRGVDFDSEDRFEDISMEKVEAYWRKVCDA